MQASFGFVNAWIIQAIPVTQPVEKRTHSFFTANPCFCSIQLEKIS